VRDVLNEIEADTVPELLVFNKADLDPDAAGRLVRTHDGSVAVSAITGAGVDDFLRTVGDRLRALTDVVDLFVPFARGDILAEVHREGEVLVETADEDGMRLRARLDDASAHRLRDWVVTPVTT
jgi:GTP-binding protein HflX